MKLAVIGGSGLESLAGLEIKERKQVQTEYGAPSAPLSIGNYRRYPLIFLARHGDHHLIPPHQINYRANIRALKSLGVTHILAVAAVGGIRAHLPPAKIVVPDQLIDYTYGRKATFYEGPGSVVTHIDFTWPYSRELIARIDQAAVRAGLNLAIGGTYGCTQGPRLESAAEILRLERDGCDIVGMTSMPEAALAREDGIEYACCAVVANWAAGKSGAEITMQEIEANLVKGIGDIERLLDELVGMML